MQSHDLDALRKRIVVGHDHATLARRDRLGRIEAEHRGLADRANQPAGTGCREGMCRILDELRSMAARDFGDGVHLAGLPCKVHRHDRLDRPVPAERLIEATRIEIERVLLDVHEQRIGAEIAHDLRARGESMHRHGYAIARHRRRSLQGPDAGPQLQSSPRAHGAHQCAPRTRLRSAASSGPSSPSRSAGTARLRRSHPHRSRASQKG